MVYSGFCCCFPLGYWGKEGCRLSDIMQCPSNGRNKAARGLWALLLVGRGSLGGEHTARLLPQGIAFASLWEDAAPVSYSINLLVSFCYFIATLLGVKFFARKFHPPWYLGSICIPGWTSSTQRIYKDLLRKFIRRTGLKSQTSSRQQEYRSSVARLEKCQDDLGILNMSASCDFLKNK